MAISAINRLVEEVAKSRVPRDDAELERQFRDPWSENCLTWAICLSSVSDARTRQMSPTE